jgi:hypothetical protein
MVTWDIRRDGHAWGGEAMSRYEMTPEKTEMVAGKLYWTEEERLTMLALLLENVGTDKAVRIGNPDIWRAAVDGLTDEREGQEHEAPARLLPQAERRALEATLLANVHAQHEALKALLDASSDHWGFEDPVYRFYHQSFKVFWLQQQTDTIVRRLGGLLPDRPLHPWFLEIVRQGTGKEFATSDNERWTLVTRPIVEAFFHARFFLEMAVRYAMLEAPPRRLPSGYAVLLYLYQLR